MFRFEQKLFYPFPFILLQDMEFARIAGFQKMNNAKSTSTRTLRPLRRKEVPQRSPIFLVSRSSIGKYLKNHTLEMALSLKILVFVIPLLWHKPAIFPNLYICMEGGATGHVYMQLFKNKTFCYIYLKGAPATYIQRTKNKMFCCMHIKGAPAMCV